MIDRGEMQKAREARAAIEIRHGNMDTQSRRRSELFAFLRVFHPEIPLSKALTMAEEAHPRISMDDTDFHSTQFRRDKKRNVRWRPRDAQGRFL